MQFFVLIFSFLCLLTTSCQHERPAGKPRVLTSIPPYAYFVQRIGGESVELQMIVPPGTDPHIFEPTPVEVEKAAHAQLWLMIGEPFETKMARVLKERNSHLVFLDLTQGISLESASSCQHEPSKSVTDPFDGLDRHLWLSPKIAQKQAGLIAQELIRINPSQKAEYEKQLSLFLQDLKAIDQEIGKLLSSLSQQAILVTHPTFTYFCRDYRLVQLAIDSDGKDPLPQHLSDLLKEAKQHRISAVITQPQYGNKGAELMARELGLSVQSIDPYSTDYLTNLRALAHLVADVH